MWSSVVGLPTYRVGAGAPTLGPIYARMPHFRLFVPQKRPN
jgi:hypothetical protein